MKKAIDEYLAGDYIASIYVLVSHFEGIVKDYLVSAGLTPKYRFESCVSDLKALVLSRAALMFPREVLDRIFAFIETGTFLAKTADIRDPAKEVTRHGIAHGVFVGFENRDVALKYLILLDALAYVLLHDKLLTATLVDGSVFGLQKPGSAGGPQTRSGPKKPVRLRGAFKSIARALVQGLTDG